MVDSEIGVKLRLPGLAVSLRFRWIFRRVNIEKSSTWKMIWTLVQISSSTWRNQRLGKIHVRAPTHTHTPRKSQK